MISLRTCPDFKSLGSFCLVLMQFGACIRYDDPEPVKRLKRELGVAVIEQDFAQAGMRVCFSGFRTCLQATRNSLLLEDCHVLLPHWPQSLCRISA